LRVSIAHLFPFSEDVFPFFSKFVPFIENESFQAKMSDATIFLFPRPPSATESTKFEWKNKKKAMELHIFLIENLFDEDLVLPTQQ